MAWAVPKHTRSQVNAAGTALISPPSSPDAVRRALVVVNNWRASHSVPLNAIRANLRNHVVSESGEEALIAQRLKRLSSIEAKLRRSRQRSSLSRKGFPRFRGHQETATRYAANWPVRPWIWMPSRVWMHTVMR